MQIRVRIPIGKQAIEGDLVLPSKAKGLVIFAHGSGSGRKSPRNRLVADVMNKSGVATLLIDLLTHEEEKADDYSGRFRFDIDLLSRRLMAATDWVMKNPETGRLAIGYFGASTGAAAALVAAAIRQKTIAAIVSRGGRPDLTMERLPEVKAPTLLIVGGNDEGIIDLNKKAMENLPGENALEIIPGATHLFEEPGKLEMVAELSARWFLTHFR